MNTHFLTENDLRRRCPEPGCTLALAPGERLTPSASEYASGMRLAIVHQDSGMPAPSTTSPARAAPAGKANVSPCVTTWLDSNTQVLKTHNRIIFRGKLDSLLATAILAETQFDPKGRLPGILKTCLHDMTNWILQVLAAELDGSDLEIRGMGGLNMDTLHAASRAPQEYLGMEHSMADAAQGGNVALINWLRALTREAEIEALRCYPGGCPICNALNRLSSALYVLMLLTMAAQKGIPLSCFKK